MQSPLSSSNASSIIISIYCNVRIWTSSSELSSKYRNITCNCTLQCSKNINLRTTRTLYKFALLHVHDSVTRWLEKNEFESAQRKIIVCHHRDIERCVPCQHLGNWNLSAHKCRLCTKIESRNYLDEIEFSVSLETQKYKSEFVRRAILYI